MSSEQETSEIQNEESPFQLGEWQVDPAGCRISRGGESIKIEPRAMAVLCSMAKHPGEVMTREMLEEEVWRGMVVGYDSLASAIIKLRKALGDDSRSPRYIETVHKKGYRLIAELGSIVAQESVAPERNDDPAGVSLGTTRKRLPVLEITLAVIVLLSFFLISLQDEQMPASIDGPDDRNVIAVLPFQNLSDDVQQDYFSDGFTADLITDLSKVSGLSVIARNSVFIFKHAEVDARKVREELGADYAVEGSVRKLGDRIRISASLIDTHTGINLWADRYDGTLSNLFEFQDEVASHIIDALEVKLTEQDETRLAHHYSVSIEAYDEFLRGWQSLWLHSREGMIQAREHFQNSIDMDRYFARAYANMAITYIYDHMLSWSDRPDEAIRLAHHFADHAISIDDSLPQVYWVKGFAHIFTGEHQRSIENAQRAIRLDPNFADAYGLLAVTLNYAGKPDEAIDMMRRAMLLNPRHPAVYKTILGEIYFNLRDYESAIENLEFALDANPESEESRLWLIAAYSHNGDTEEAQWQLDQIQHTGSEITLDYLERVMPFRDPKQRDHLVEGLYRAGLDQ